MTLRDTRPAGAGRERDTAIDLIKAAAIFCVVVIHCCGRGYSFPVLSVQWTSAVFWGSAARAAVPLFFMCSGALLLDPDRPLTLKKLYGKNILRILAALFFWAAAYKLYHLLVETGWDAFRFQAPAEWLWPGLLQAGKELVLFRHEFHLYYLHIILLVYAFLPVTRILAGRASRRELGYLLLLWFALGILYPTLIHYWPFSLYYKSGIPKQWLMNMTYASLGYGMLGYCQRRWPLGRGKSAALLAAGFAVVFGGTVLSSARSGSLYEGFLEGMSVGVALMAAGIFGLCTALGSALKGRTARFAARLSEASFCIYLSHLFVRYAFDRLGITVLLLPCAVSIPLLSLAVLGLSYCVWLVLRRIPGVRRWLI